MLTNSYCRIKRYYQSIQWTDESVRYLIPKEGDAQQAFIEIEINTVQNTFLARQKPRAEIDFSQWQLAVEPGSATGLFTQFLHPELFSPSFVTRPDEPEYA